MQDRRIPVDLLRELIRDLGSDDVQRRNEAAVAISVPLHGFSSVEAFEAKAYAPADVSSAFQSILDFWPNRKTLRTFQLDVQAVFRLPNFPVVDSIRRMADYAVALERRRINFLSGSHDAKLGMTSRDRYLFHLDFVVPRVLRSPGSGAIAALPVYLELLDTTVESSSSGLASSILKWLAAEAIASMGKAGESGFDSLLKHYGNDQPVVSALQRILRTSELSRNNLIKALACDSPDRRRAAINLLEKQGVRLGSLRDIAIEALSDPDREVKKTAARILRTQFSSDASAMDALQAAVKRPSPPPAKEAIQLPECPWTAGDRSLADVLLMIADTDTHKRVDADKHLVAIWEYIGMAGATEKFRAELVRTLADPTFPTARVLKEVISAVIRVSDKAEVEVREYLATSRSESMEWTKSLVQQRMLQLIIQNAGPSAVCVFNELVVLLESQPKIKHAHESKSATAACALGNLGLSGVPAFAAIFERAAGKHGS